MSDCGDCRELESRCDGWEEKVAALEARFSELDKKRFDFVNANTRLAKRVLELEKQLTVRIDMINDLRIETAAMFPVIKKAREMCLRTAGHCFFCKTLHDMDADLSRVSK